VWSRAKASNGQLARVMIAASRRGSYRVRPGRRRHRRPVALGRVVGPEPAAEVDVLTGLISRTDPLVSHFRLLPACEDALEAATSRLDPSTQACSIER
jgi:hypothetical protein